MFLFFKIFVCNKHLFVGDGLFKVSFYCVTNLGHPFLRSCPHPRGRKLDEIFSTLHLNITEVTSHICQHTVHGIYVRLD